MSNLKTKLADRNRAMRKAMGDEDLEKKSYNKSFDSAASVTELKKKRDELSKEWKKTKENSLLNKINELNAKISKLEKAG
jgi:hypothetical protein